MITGSVVLYNSAQDIVERLIYSFGVNEDRRIILIDNSEKRTDIYLNREYIEYIYNEKNLGYGSGHNIGIKKAIEYNSEYHIVLNPDLFFESNIIDELKMYADSDKSVVYILPKVIGEDGNLQYLCKLLPTPFDLFVRRFLPNIGLFQKLNDRYTLKVFGYDKIINPPCLSGCFMFLRTAVLKRNNLFFDEKFFMYCEDFDLIRRLHRVGKTIYYPKVTIVHHHEKSSYKSRKMLMLHIKSACLYFNKYGWIWDKERKMQNKKILKEAIDDHI